jgi:hypothetical protein
MTFDPQFPYSHVADIGKSLEASGCLVAGYEPPSLGLLAIPGIIYAQQFDELSIRILPDRNLVSRMANVARHGLPGPLDEPTSLAIKLMAFAQAMNILIEPSIAFHELAQRDGNERAHEELRWFRSAHQAQARGWIEIAMGRADRLPVTVLAEKSNEDLARALSRWRRNYIVALKVAEIELTAMPPLKKVRKLLDWLVDEFIVAGPAATFSVMYLSPNTPRKRMIKSLRSRDRERAIEGIKNAAWDMTHLSDFVLRSSRCEKEGTRNIFATADKKLAEIAPVLLVKNEHSSWQNHLSEALSRWWSQEKDACQIARWLADCFALVNTRPPPGTRGTGHDPIGELIKDGEARVRAWMTP